MKVTLDLDDKALERLEKQASGQRRSRKAHMEFILETYSWTEVRPEEFPLQLKSRGRAEPAPDPAIAESEPLGKSIEIKTTPFGQYQLDIVAAETVEQCQAIAGEISRDKNLTPAEKNSLSTRARAKSKELDPNNP